MKKILMALVLGMIFSTTGCEHGYTRYDGFIKDCDVFFEGDTMDATLFLYQDDRAPAVHFDFGNGITSYSLDIDRPQVTKDSIIGEGQFYDNGYIGLGLAFEEDRLDGMVRFTYDDGDVLDSYVCDAELQQSN
jgi:hypothetical protein